MKTLASILSAVGVLLVALAIEFPSCPAYGDDADQTVILKDGRKLHGQATEEGDHIVLKMALGTINIPKSNVASIDQTHPSPTTVPSTDSLAENVRGPAHNAQQTNTAWKVKDSDIAARRNQLLGAIDDKIASLQTLLDQMPENARAGSSVSERMKKLQQDRAQAAAISDDVVASQIMAERDKAAAQVARVQQEAERQRQMTLQQQQQAQADEQQRKDELVAKLHSKFPNWNGPWKTCPICQGTGRDEDAERDENMRRASVVGSQVAGTNGVTKIAGAVIACDVCGGTGVVPDYGDR